MLVTTEVSGYVNIFLQVLYYFCSPHFLWRKEDVGLSDKVDNGSGLVGHGVFLSRFQHCPLQGKPQCVAL